jgi:anti-sigma-K factor RskA
MTGGNEPSSSHECGDDVAAYALGALDPEDTAAFERHLESCAICRDELDAFEQVVDRLPMSAPVHPAPAGLRRRVMRAVAESSRGTAVRSRRPRVRLTMPKPAMALTAVLATTVIVFGGLELESSSPATRVIRAQVTSQGLAELRLTGTSGQLILHRFSPPPAGEIYEVWLKRPGRPPAPTTALFSVTAAGDGTVDVPGDLHGVSLIMVTPEPAGGTLTPTHPPVLSVRLA